MYIREGHVHCWDISHVIRLLSEHNTSQLVISRAIRYHHHNVNITPPNPYLDSLIDDFICHAINSFQIVAVAEFNPQRVTSQELTWFNMNEYARSQLWQLTRGLAIEYAGSMVNYARIGSMIYLYAQTN